jgi:tetratricopeptide (TPR) repeat protein
MALLSAFNPHEFSEATIRTVATGREADLKEILGTVRANLGADTIQHLILSAPRGYGKSFMMRHVQIEVERIARDEKLPLAVVLTPEEMPHVKEPETLLRELTRALVGGPGADAELTWHEDDGEALEAAMRALEAAIREKLGENGLCVALVENFDVLLRRAFPRDVHRSRLRAFLTQRESRLVLIAASASGAFDRDYDSRLFQAFKEVALEPWSIEDCLAFFDRQRKDAGKPPLDDFARARAKAVALFIGGTPRLATLLGDVLLGEDVLRAADLLKRLVDELTPYYKERIEALPGRSQKLLDALLRGGEPATPSEIARRVKANSQSAIAGPFSDLAKERIVVGEKAPGSAEVLYRVADRVFAHYYRFRVVEHGRQMCPLEALVDLLSDYYSPDEKRGKAAEFARQGRIEEARVMARLHDSDRGRSKVARRAMLDDLARYYIPLRLVPLASAAKAAVLRSVARFARDGEVDEAYARIADSLTAATLPQDRVLLFLARSCLDAFEGVEGGLAAADEAVAAAESVENRRYSLLAGLRRAWSLNSVDRHAESLGLSERLRDEAKLLSQTFEESIALRYAAYSLTGLNRDMEAVESAKRASKLAAKTGDVRGQAMALGVAAYGLCELARYEEAVESANGAAELAAQAEQSREQARALRAAAHSLGQLARHEEAIESAKRAAELAEKAGDSRERSIDLRYAALNLRMVGHLTEASKYYRGALELAKRAKEWFSDLEWSLLRADCLSGLGEPVAAIGAVADAAQVLEVAPTNARQQFWLSEVCRCTAWDALYAPNGNFVDVSVIHEILAALLDKLDAGSERLVCLQSWLEAFTTQVIRRSDAPDWLENLARAIELHFPGRFAHEMSRLTAAAGYHRSGRDRAALARLDPDFAKTLETIFPPPEVDKATPKQPGRPQRRKSAK